MSDAFLESDLTLDIRAALGQVDRLNEALSRATTDVRVTADVRAVTAAIDAAVDAADTAVTFAGDAAPLTGAIDAAVEEANTDVTITGDAAALTGDVDAAIEAADTNVTVTGDAANVTGAIDAAVENADTTVAVDGSVSPGLTQGVDNLGDSLDAAATSGISLGTILAGLSATAAIAGLRALSDAASDLQESTSKASVVFGDDFAEIERFAQGAAQSTGLAAQEALEATATFGNLFQALGSTQEEAAALSPEVVQLAADLASFNNLGVDEVLEKLRSGLVGEVEPLRSLGVSFLAADVTARGLALGLGDVNGELSEGEKVQARYSLIAEQTALAQGDFARTSEGLANQQRILSAELGNAAAAAGTALLPAFEALIAEARGAVPSLGQIADDVLPAISDAIVNLAPLLGTTVDLFVLAAPAIGLVAELLALIPDEVIAVGAGLLVANKALGIFGSLAAGVPKILSSIASTAPGAAGGVAGLAGSISALNPLTVAASVLAVGLFTAWQTGQEEARAYAEELDQLASSLETVDGFQQLTTAGLSAYVAEQSRINAKGQIDDLNRLGISFDQLSEFVQRGAAGQLEFVDALVKGGDLTRVTRNEYGELVTATGEVIDANSDLANSLEDVGFGQLVVGNTDLVESYQEIARVTDDVAKRQIELLQAQGLLTDAQVREALATNDSGEATRGYAEALNLLEPQIVAAARAAERAIAEYGPLADQFVATGEALALVREESDAVSSAIEGLRSGGKGTDRDFLNLALALDQAALSEEGFAAAAALLGTNAEDLQAFVDGAAESLTSFVDNAVDALPALSDAFAEVGDDGILSLAEFRANLETQAEDVRNFTLRLAFLTQQGFGELAGVIAQQGPEVAGALVETLATALAEGDRALVESTQASLDEFTGAWEGGTAYLRDVLGPEFVLTTGLIGDAATTTFGENLDFGERLRIAGEIAALQMDASGQAVAAIAATEGENAAREYGDALGLDDEVIEASVKAGAAIKANAPVDAASTAGKSVGQAFADGITEGISNRQGSVNDRAQQIVLQAEAAARRAARSQSPSRLFADLGAALAEGLAIGMEAETAQVEAASQALIDASAGRVSAARVDSSLLTTGITGAASGGSVGGVAVRFEAGSIVVNPAPGMTEAEARTIGAAIADGMDTRLAERTLSVLAQTV